MKAWVLAFVLGAFAIAPFLYLAYHDNEVAMQSNQPRLQTSLAVVDFTIPLPLELEEGLTFSVTSCQVLDGYQYMLTLEGGHLIEAHLPVATKREAIPVVIDAFNKTSMVPKVKLLRNVGDIYWIVDVQLMFVDGKLERLVDVLRLKGLTLD